MSLDERTPIAQKKEWSADPPNQCKTDKEADKLSNSDLTDPLTESDRCLTGRPKKHLHITSEQELYRKPNPPCAMQEDYYSLIESTAKCCA